MEETITVSMLNEKCHKCGKAITNADEGKWEGDQADGFDRWVCYNCEPKTIDLQRVYIQWPVSVEEFTSLAGRKLSSEHEYTLFVDILRKLTLARFRATMDDLCKDAYAEMLKKMNPLLGPEDDNEA